METEKKREKPVQVTLGRASMVFFLSSTVGENRAAVESTAVGRAYLPLLERSLGALTPPEGEAEPPPHDVAVRAHHALGAAVWAHLSATQKLSELPGTVQPEALEAARRVAAAIGGFERVRRRDAVAQSTQAKALSARLESLGADLRRVPPAQAQSFEQLFTRWVDDGVALVGALRGEARASASARVSNTPEVRKAAGYLRRFRDALRDEIEARGLPSTVELDVFGVHDRLLEAQTAAAVARREKAQKARVEAEARQAKKDAEAKARREKRAPETGGTSAPVGRGEASTGSGSEATRTDAA